MKQKVNYQYNRCNNEVTNKQKQITMYKIGNKIQMNDLRKVGPMNTGTITRGYDEYPQRHRYPNMKHYYVKWDNPWPSTPFPQEGWECLENDLSTHSNFSYSLI